MRIDVNNSGEFPGARHVPGTVFPSITRRRLHIAYEMAQQSPSAPGPGIPKHAQGFLPLFLKVSPGHRATYGTRQVRRS